MNRPAPSLPVQSVTCTLLTSRFQLDWARLEPHFKIVPGTTTQWKRLTQWKAPIRDCSGLATGQASMSMNTYGISLDRQTALSHREQNNPKQYSRYQENSPNCFSIGGESGTSSSGPHTVHACAVCGILQMQEPLQMGRGWKGTWTSCVMAPDSEFFFFFCHELILLEKKHTFTAVLAHLL